MSEPDPPTQPEPSSQGGAKAKTKVLIEEYRSRQAAKEKESRGRELERQLEEEQRQRRESIEAQKVEQARLHETEIREAEIARIKHEQEQLRLEQERVQKELEANAELLASQAQEVPMALGSHTPCYDEHGQELDYHDDVPATTDSQEYKNRWSDYFRQQGDEYGAQITESLDAECKLLQGPTMTSTASEEAVLLKEETPTVDMRQFLAGLETLTPAMLSELSTHIEHLRQLAAPLASTTSSSTQKESPLPPPGLPATPTVANPMQQALLEVTKNLGTSPTHQRMPTRPPGEEETERAAALLIEQMAKAPGTPSQKHDRPS